jgi:hypothetical protein
MRPVAPPSAKEEQAITLIPINCPAKEWTTLPPPLCASDVQRLKDAADMIRFEHTDEELRGLEPVIQVWFNCDCIFTQDIVDGYAWLPSDLSNSAQGAKKIRVALMDGTKPAFTQELPWPEPDGATGAI